MKTKKLLWRGLVLSSLLLTVAPNPAQAATTVAGTTTFTGVATTGVGVLVMPPTTVTTATTLVGQIAGSFTVNGTNVTAVANCAFNGTTTDNIAKGDGSLAGTCSGTAVVTPPGITVTFNVSCTVEYLRVGTTVSVTATCTGAAGVTVPFQYCANGVLQWIPTWTQGDEFTVTGALLMRPVPVGGCLLL